MHSPRAVVAVSLLLLFAAQPARAADTAERPIVTHMEWTLRQTGDQSWDTAWSLSGSTGIGAATRLRFAGTVVYDLTGGAVEGWGRTAAECRLNGCTLILPGKLEYEDGKTSASFGLSLDPRWKGVEAQLDLGCEKRWYGGESDYSRGTGGLHLAGSFENRLFISADAEVNATRYGGAAEGSRLYGRVSTECRYVAGPGSYIRGRAGWSGFAYPEAPEDDCSVFRISLNYVTRPDRWYLNLSVYGDRGLGRLASDYVEGEFRARANTPLGPGTLTLSSGVDGILHLDAATTAHDRVHWFTGAGYNCPLGNTTIDIQLFYESTHYDDGTVNWVLGPSLAVSGRPGEHWRLTARWAPDGDLFGGGQGLRIAVEWMP